MVAVFMTKPVQIWHYGLVAEETHSIVINLYSKEEIETALDIAGFRNLRVTGELLSRPALPTDDRIVFYATA